MGVLWNAEPSIEMCIRDSFYVVFPFIKMRFLFSLIDLQTSKALENYEFYPEMPFVMIQLPRINDPSKIRAGWPDFREMQDAVLALCGAAAAAKRRRLFAEE